MRTRRRPLTAATATCSLAIAGCLNSDVPFETNAGDSPDQALTLLDHELVRSDTRTLVETVSVEGRAENTAEDRLRYVPLEARFLNDRGEQRKVAITNTTRPDLGVWSSLSGE